MGFIGVQVEQLMNIVSGQEITLNSPSSPLFQQGERVLKGGRAVRYHYKPTGWSTADGTLWLTNQRIIFSPGFGHQQNWPLDHISEVRIGALEQQDLLQFLFSNGMREHFALETQEQWITAVTNARGRLKSVAISKKERISQSEDDRHYSRVAAVATAVLFLTAACIFTIAAFLLLSR
jgi:hypothetical protein